MRAAQDLLDAVWDSRTGPLSRRPPRGLLDEWEDAEILAQEFAKATVLARLGGLLHDLCHVPLGHTIEDDLSVLTAHDANAARFERLWNKLDERARCAIDSDAGLKRRLRPLILSKEIPDEEDESSRRPPIDAIDEFAFVQDIVGNTICADLMDYLRRDHLNTGLPMEVGRRFLSSFYVTTSNDPLHKCRMVIQISSAGKERVDIVTELLKYLRYRYELTERVLTHHAKTAVDAMIGKLLEMWSDSVYTENVAGVDAYADLLERHDAQRGLEGLKKELGALAPAVELPADRLKRGDKTLKPSAAVHVRFLVEDSLEERFTGGSDDGLLEYLAGYKGAAVQGTVGPLDERRALAISELASDVLDRKLFKPLGRADSPSDRAVAARIYETFGDHDSRRELERRAAKWAGLGRGWHVVLWIPNPGMRLKVAEVLVDNGEGVAQLDALEPASKDIVEAHKRLWFVGIYAHHSVRDRAGTGHDHTGAALLGFFSQQLGIHVRRWDGGAALKTNELAASLVIDRGSSVLDRPALQRQLSHELVAAGAGGDETFEHLLHRTWRTAATHGWVSEELPGDLYRA